MFFITCIIIREVYQKVNLMMSVLHLE